MFFRQKNDKKEWVKTEKIENFGSIFGIWIGNW